MMDKNIIVLTIVFAKTIRMMKLQICLFMLKG